jgi:hypothetical protein
VAAPAQQPKDISPKQADKGAAEVIGELWQLIKDYGKQETIDPLKNLALFVGFGASGSILLGLGVMFLSLTALRGLQQNTGPIGRHLTGSLTWVPYAATLVFLVLLILLAVKAIQRTSRRHSTDRAEDIAKERM